MPSFFQVASIRQPAVFANVPDLSAVKASAALFPLLLALGWKRLAAE
jgi:hypothetical protein